MSRGKGPKQLIGLTSDNAHSDPTLLLSAQEAQARFARARLCLPYNKGRKETLRPK
jgi:hypothetical protein